ncbi:cell wall-binding repeat-containing protein [Thermococci archaeon]|nr:MAG: cell wall-binding repeat-containing protein [Thermococci archaeon]
MRALFSIFLSLLLLTIALPGYINAQVKDFVILVSDNEADLTLAQKIAVVLDAKVIVSPWGIYNESVVPKILDADPSFVLIIGGPMAVPEEYEKDLEDLGIPHTRLYGSTRVETAQVVINWIKKDYPDLFKDIKFAVVYGWDFGAIMKVRSMKGVIPIFIGYNPVNITIPEEDVVAIMSRDSEEIMEKITGKFRVRSRMRVVITQEVAKETIEESSIVISRAEEVLREVESIGSMGARAWVFLDAAKGYLKKAKSSYEEGDYIKAYEYAKNAKIRAERAIVLARAGEKGPGLEISRRIKMLEITVIRLKARGIDVSNILPLIEKAKSALESGNVGEAMNYVEMAMKLIREKTRGHGENGRAHLNHGPKH